MCGWLRVWDIEPLDCFWSSAALSIRVEDLDIDRSGNNIIVAVTLLDLKDKQLTSPLIRSNC
jgi:hypothetical protein